MAEAAWSSDGLEFLRHCYRFVDLTWPHSPRDESSDQGFEAQFRAESIRELRGWTVSQHREMGFGIDVEPASGAPHEVDLIASTERVTGIAELKKREDQVVGKNDVIVFFAKLVDYLCHNPFLLLKDVCPVFLTSLSFDMSGLAACLGLGIHPVSPKLRPLPYLAWSCQLIASELDYGVVVTQSEKDAAEDLTNRVTTLLEDLDNTWVGHRFIQQSETQIGVIAADPPLVQTAARELLAVNAMATELIGIFKSKKQAAS